MGLIVGTWGTVHSSKERTSAYVGMGMGLSVYVCRRVNSTGGENGVQKKNEMTVEVIGVIEAIEAIGAIGAIEADAEAGEHLVSTSLAYPRFSIFGWPQMSKAFSARQAPVAVDRHPSIHKYRMNTDVPAAQTRRITAISRIPITPNVTPQISERVFAASKLRLCF